MKLNGQFDPLDKGRVWRELVRCEVNAFVASHESSNQTRVAAEIGKRKENVSDGLVRTFVARVPVYEAFDPVGKYSATGNLKR